MNTLNLYRKRFIPQETVLLKNDIVLYQDVQILITKWRVLKPRADFQKGFSYYFLKKGYKISKFFKKNDDFVYYYCDIISTSYEKETNTFVFTDLLADVIVEPNGFVRVLDLGEISDALDANLISIETAKMAVCQLDQLLQLIYSNQLKQTLAPYERYEDNT